MTASDATDASLLADYRSGAQAAFDQLYSRHKDALYHHARAILRDDGQAEEAAHEALLELVASGDPRLAPDGTLGPFLHTTVRRLALDRLRSEKAARKREAAFSNEWIRSTNEKTDRETIERLNRTISRLPQAELEVLLLHNYSGLTFEQVGEALEISPNTAASRYRYAIKKLAEFLGDVR